MASGLIPSVRSRTSRASSALHALPALPIPAATWPRDDRGDQRLLVIDPGRSRVTDRTLDDLGELLTPGDLLVFNDAATVPASLAATSESGARLELRLAREHAGIFWAIVLGEGDWRWRTEDRKPPPPLSQGETLTFTPAEAGGGAAFTARVLELAPLGTPYSPEHPLIAIRFGAEGGALWDALYLAGRPIQYSYTERPLELWHVHNVFASQPWAFELASAAHGFTWKLLLALARRGIRFASLTHAAGISSTGSPKLDRLLPFPERYRIPEATVLEIERTREHEQRVVAVGTTVVRALESAWSNGKLHAGLGDATLVIGPSSQAGPSDRLTREPRLVDSVISGIHQAGESHHSLLEAFAPRALLERAESLARARGYRTHEFGDACLVLRDPQGGTRF